MGERPRKKEGKINKEGRGWESPSLTLLTVSLCAYFVMWWVGWQLFFFQHVMTSMYFGLVLTSF